MIISHTTNKCTNFKRFVRDRVAKEVISLDEEHIQILSQSMFNKALRED